MKKQFGTAVIASLMLLMCSNCTQPSTTTDKGTPKAILDPKDPNAGNGAKKPGAYCFQFKDANLTIDGHIDLAEGNMVDGFLKGHVKDATDGSETEWDASFKGPMEGESLKVDVLSSETGVKEQTKETWTWKSDGLTKGDRLLKPIDCI